MSSDAPAECFVYVHLPGETLPVTAGRLALGTDRHGTAEGRFVYGRSYLARSNAVALCPVELKLSTRTYSTVAMGGVFAALRDASPDFWGRRLIQRHLGRAQPSEMDYLLCSPDDRAGALGFGLNATPPAPIRAFNRTLDLAQLQTLTDAIVADDEPAATRAGPKARGKAKGVAKATPKDHSQIEKLLNLGTSMGGARPKAVVEDDSGLWLAKFNRSDDAWNNARVEHAMLTLASACGLNAADSQVQRVAGRDVLLVRRFDRQKVAQNQGGGYLRARMVSALTLLRADESLASRSKWSYVLLAEELRRVCAEPQANTRELFKRMCFNALISNIDDHPRNHAVIARNTAWFLSPAYDLTPFAPVSSSHRDLAMECGDAGRFANAANLLTQSARFLLSAGEARHIIDTMHAQVRATWLATARTAGVSARDCDKIAPAFVFAGFGRAGAV
jgi:serine/threonine-protein kinase HipA